MANAALLDDTRETMGATWESARRAAPLEISIV